MEKQTKEQELEKEIREQIMRNDIDDYIIKQIYKKKKSVKIELKKGKFKGSDNKYHSCLIALFDNRFIQEDFATECFEGSKFNRLRK